MNPEFINFGFAGLVTSLFALAIKEYFSLQKARKVKNTAEFDGKEFQVQILTQIERIATNDLAHIQVAIDLLSKRVVDVIHADNIIMIQILSEIKGKLK